MANISGRPSNIRAYTSGICVYQDRYLLLRISESYKICPGDWEWLTCSLKFSKFPCTSANSIALRKNVLATLKQQVGLEGKIVKYFPLHRWYDREYKFHFILYPILIQIESPNLSISKDKFTEYRWVESRNIWNYDRNNYLTDFIDHLNRFGGL